MKTIAAVLLCGCAAVVNSGFVVTKLEKAKVRVASLDPVAADTPADTKLLKATEKELEVPAAPFITYAAQPRAMLHFLRKKRALVVGAKIEKAKVRVASLDPVAADTPADTKLLKVTEKEWEVPTAPIITYAAYPNSMYHILRRKRDLVTAKVRTAGLAAVAAETPADTALLQPVISEHQLVMPAAQMMYVI